MPRISAWTRKPPFTFLRSGLAKQVVITVSDIARGSCVGKVFVTVRTMRLHKNSLSTSKPGILQATAPKFSQQGVYLFIRIQPNPHLICGIRAGKRQRMPTPASVVRTLDRLSLDGKLVPKWRKCLLKAFMQAKAHRGRIEDGRS
jgi:hypothetical protein